ncbi:MAG: hypothetical protein M3T49_06780 [Candidatus Eremiobacteraeota bacterium]|nr:hypothetical protein [Candidatus Eremiobacteraeota bacterium]
MSRFRFFGASLIAVGVLSASATDASALNGPTALRNSYPWVRSAVPRPGLAFPFRGHVLVTPWTETRLHAFTGADGSGPNGLIRDAQGAFYGTTAYGGGTGCGGSGCGTVFKLTPPMPGQPFWTASVLYSFTGGPDGANPFEALILDRSGALYGTASGGGLNGYGTVFKLAPPASGQSVWNETVLYSFAGGADGADPNAGLTYFRGALYSTTVLGGALGFGTAFQLTPPGYGRTTWTESVIHSFGVAGDGKYPYAGFIEARGALYSTTFLGGDAAHCFSGCGVVFALTPPASGNTAWTETIVHSFTGLDGFAPFTDLVKGPSGALYGTASGGGGGGCDSVVGCGTVFELSPPLRNQSTWHARVILYFNGENGYSPYSSLRFDERGNLYGSAYSGGPWGAGLVFELTPCRTSWTERVLHAFTGGADGGYPVGNLIVGERAALYGVTFNGGACSSCGVVFKLQK